MSYAENPETNPYVAPKSQVSVDDFGRTAAIGYAGFWRRFGAYFIDSIIMGLVGVVLGIVLGAAASDQTRANMSFIIIQLASIAISIAYYAGMESSGSQATLGKQALGIKVTDLNGRRITFGRAVGRFFGKILSALILMIGFIMAAFTERKQALHDMIAGTLVVRTR